MKEMNIKYWNGKRNVEVNADVEVMDYDGEKIAVKNECYDCEQPVRKVKIFGNEFKVWINEMYDFSTDFYGTYFKIMFNYKCDSLGIEGSFIKDETTTGYDSDYMENNWEYGLEEGIWDEDGNILNQERYDELVNEDEEMWFDYVKYEDEYWDEELMNANEDDFLEFVKKSEYRYLLSDILEDMNKCIKKTFVGGSFNSENKVYDITVNGEHKYYEDENGDKVLRFINKMPICCTNEYIVRDGQIWNNEYYGAEGNKVFSVNGIEVSKWEDESVDGFLQEGDVVEMYDYDSPYMVKEAC